MEKHDSNDEARKLSNEEMEGAKGGATFANLSKFVVTSDLKHSSIIGKINPVADTTMCAGQTRSILLDFDNVVFKP